MNRRSWRFALFAALTGFASATFAATDLLTAWQAAQRHDAEFAAEKAQWQAGQTLRRQARALLLPQVQAEGSIGRRTLDSTTEGAQFSAAGFGAPGIANFSNSIEDGDASRWALSARQPLYDAERFAGYTQTQRQAEMADVQYRAAEQQLLLRTAQAYFDCVRAAQRVQTLRALRSAAGNARKEADARFRAGDVAVTDRDEAQARFDLIAADEIAASTQLQQARTAFSAITGLAADDLVPVQSHALPAIDALADWQARALANNPMVALRRAGVEIADAEIDKFRLLTSPKLDLVAQVGEERFDGDGDFGNAVMNNSGWAVGVQLTVPIFTGGMRSAKRDEAAARAEQRRFDLDAVQTLVSRQTESAWLGVSSGAARADALLRAQASAAQRLQSTRTGYRVGARTALDQLNAEADYFHAQSALTDARCQLLFSQLQLDAAAGVLDEQSLRRVNDALSASASAAQ
jgi:outer membrane protein